MEQAGITEVRKAETPVTTSIMLWNEPNNLSHWDFQMDRLRDFDVTLTLCFTPPSRGIVPSHTSPPQDVGEYAYFCRQVARRYAR